MPPGAAYHLLPPESLFSPPRVEITRAQALVYFLANKELILCVSEGRGEGYLEGDAAGTAEKVEIVNFKGRNNPN